MSDFITSQDPGQHPCGSQPEADVIATAPLAPAAWRYTIHYEGGQTRSLLSFVNRSPFGVPGEDHSEEYPVTCEPLFVRSRPDAIDALHAIVAWNTITATEWHERWPQWSRLSTVEEVALAALATTPEAQP